jgi:hypothetical protein
MDVSGQTGKSAKLIPHHRGEVGDAALYSHATRIVAGTWR